MSIQINDCQFNSFEIMLATWRLCLILKHNIGVKILKKIKFVHHTNVNDIQVVE